MGVRVALPKGRLLKPTAEMLAKAGWGLEEYSEKTRLYRLSSQRFPNLKAKMFHEKDIPIQVAIGNYDLGICGLDWVLEQQVKYPSSAIVKLRNLGYGEGAIYVAADASSIHQGTLETRGLCLRLASEYPNLAESLAQQLRLPRFSIFPLWGAAEGYPPEDAELVLLSRKDEVELTSRGLVSLGRMVNFKAYLIANRESLKSLDMTELLTSLNDTLGSFIPDGNETLDIPALRVRTTSKAAEDQLVRLALPDGHQQAHVRKILDAAGLVISDYPSTTGNRRPPCELAGFTIKVIRPQDMPQQVACGNYDVAITGRDWLTDHCYQFPSSPVQELLDLKYGWVRIVAAVANDVPATNSAELLGYWQKSGKPLRVASEYINVADYYARSNHFGDYRVIPTWGATEAFIPEDADLLIENTETGSTIARHSLKIIETFFESTACVVSRNLDSFNAIKRSRIEGFIKQLGKGVEALS
jgi:ATP phosphoribosyltransferase